MMRKKGGGASRSRLGVPRLEHAAPQRRDADHDVRVILEEGVVDEASTTAWRGTGR